MCWSGGAFLSVDLKEREEWRIVWIRVGSGEEGDRERERDKPGLDVLKRNVKPDMKKSKRVRVDEREKSERDVLKDGHGCLMQGKDTHKGKGKKEGRLKGKEREGKRDRGQRRVFKGTKDKGQSVQAKEAAGEVRGTKKKNGGKRRKKNMKGRT